MVAGAALCLGLSLFIWGIAMLPWNHKIQLSPLTLAIVAGMVLGNTMRKRHLDRIEPGIRFSQQKILRLGIVLYGLRLTGQDLFRLGPQALALDLATVASVLLIGYWFGTHVLKLDPDTALLVSAGRCICGA